MNNPAEANSLIQKDYNITDSAMVQILSQNQFSVSLDQSLISAMQDEALWLMQDNLTNSTAIPDFHNYIYENGLKSVNPDYVNIVG